MAEYFASNARKRLCYFASNLEKIWLWFWYATFTASTFLLFSIDLLEWHLVMSKMCRLSYLCSHIMQCSYYILQDVADLYVMLCNYAGAIY